MRLLSKVDSDSGHYHGHEGYGAIKERQQHHHHREQSLNVKAVYLETLSDTIGAAGVVAAGVIILTTKFYLVDPIISIGYGSKNMVNFEKCRSYIDGRFSGYYTS